MMERFTLLHRSSEQNELLNTLTLSLCLSLAVQKSFSPKVSSDSNTVFRLFPLRSIVLFIHFTLLVPLALLWFLGVLFMLCVSVSRCDAVFGLPVLFESEEIQTEDSVSLHQPAAFSFEGSFYELVLERISHLML